MLTIETIVNFLEQFAPTALAESWDNVGLLVGNRRRSVARVMTCLTITPITAAEAIQRKAGLIVTHHPLPFESLSRLTADTTTGRLLLDLIAERIAVYSPHTALDSAPQGINQLLAKGLGLRGVTPLVDRPGHPPTGRWGWLAEPMILSHLAEQVKQFLAIDHLQLVGDPQQSVRTVAVACGAAGELLEAAQANGCDCMLLGEARFHTCLEALALGVGLLLPGHFASERFAIESLAEVLSQRLPGLEVWASREECDPVRWV
jgi:dinuclear metal center YbgI/SA1388 family protein